MKITPYERSYFLDPAERAGSTFIQHFTVVLLATGSAGFIDHQSWLLAADTAGFAAIISLLTSLITFGVPKLNPELDLALRVVKTFAQSFLGVLAASAMPQQSVVHANWSAALAVAIPTAIAAGLKGLAALPLSWSDGASLLPNGNAPVQSGELDYGLPLTSVADAGEDTPPVILPGHVEANLADSAGAHAAPAATVDPPVAATPVVPAD